MCLCFYEQGRSIYICFSIFNCFIFIVRILSKPEVWVDPGFRAGKGLEATAEAWVHRSRAEVTWDLRLTPGHTVVLSIPPGVC